MMDDDDLQRVYQWVDEIPLSRPNRNIARDFADGVLTAEIVAHYFPRLIEIHNDPAANSYAQKMYNWCADAAIDSFENALPCNMLCAAPEPLALELAASSLHACWCESFSPAVFCSV